MKKNKKPLIALTAVIAVILVGATVAYFATSVDFDNVFTTGTYQTNSIEVFTSPSNWKPGEKIDNTVVVENEGSIPVAVRVSYTSGVWTDSNGDELDPQPTGKVTINFANQADWISNTETDGVTYYYYKEALDPNATTTSFISGVTLNSDAITGDNVTCTTSADGLSKTCESTDDLTGATYTMQIKTETVQFDAYKTVWGTNVTISE